jgi:hypothetical protein
MVEWWMKVELEGFGTKQPLLNRGHIQEFASRDWENPRKASVSAAHFFSGIQSSCRRRVRSVIAISTSSVMDNIEINQGEKRWQLWSRLNWVMTVSNGKSFWRWQCTCRFHLTTRFLNQPINYIFSKENLCSMRLISCFQNIHSVVS